MSFSKSFYKTAATAIAAAALMAACSPSTNGASDPNADKPEELISEAVAKMEEAIKLAQTTSGPGSPAMWKLADDDTTVHIFGTVHILKPETEWRSDTFDQAFSDADKIVLEIAMESEADQQAVAMQMMSASVFDDGRELSDVLSEEELETVYAGAKALGVPSAALDVQEPWAIALTFLNVKMMQDGYDPNSGVERVLTEEAKSQGKTFASLESPEFQISVFDNMSMESQIKMLVEGTETLHLSDYQLSSMVDEWADGDVAGLGVIAANPDTAGMDEFYEALFVRRNTNWIPKIEALLEEPGTVMVAVGAGHLAGPDSVITMLEDKGHTLTRTQ